MNTQTAPILQNNYYKSNGTPSPQWSFLIYSIVSFIIFIAFYLVFLYIPAVEYENEFDTLLDQANDTLALTRDYAGTVENYNNIAFSVYGDICENVVNNPCLVGPPDLPFCVLTLSEVIGNTFDDFCTNLNNSDS